MNETIPNQDEGRDDMIARHLCGELSESDKARLAELLDNDPEMQKRLVEQSEWQTRIAEGLRDLEQNVEQNSAEMICVQAKVAKPLATASPWLFLVAAAMIMIAAGLHFARPAGSPGPRSIATISGLSGSLRWTGDGGQVSRDLEIGTKLSGGTIDGLSPESWFELKFNDGSTVMISGTSMLVFSDRDQKVLHLKEGILSASVQPQPTGKPMLIHTRSAVLEVLGTKFEVDAGVASTVLNVSEGKVRVKRLSDGSSTDVPAKHRIVAAVGRAFSIERVPDSVHRWKSRFGLGPKRTHGVWLPATQDSPAGLKTIPYITEDRKTIFTASMNVSGGDRPSVVLSPESRVRVRGILETSHPTYLGMTIHTADGDFAGRFQTIFPAETFESGKPFEVLVNLGDFALDSSLNHMKEQLPQQPDGLVVVSIWCHTLFDQVGLTIHEIEILGNESEHD